MKNIPKSLLKLEDGKEEMITDLEGASRTILIDEQTVGAEDITFGHSKFEPHTSIHKKHIHHNAEEIMYMLKGRGISGVGDNETEMVAGDTVWVPRGAVHWFYNPFDEPCEFLFIYTRKSLRDAGYEIVKE
ncbi:MAG: cupin domain-containing protein [Desulfobacterales bacterium]|jgi:quercetin dioxygenase-like cupin family protein